jgi:hypothetical protein
MRTLVAAVLIAIGAALALDRLDHSSVTVYRSAEGNVRLRPMR